MMGALSMADPVVQAETEPSSITFVVAPPGLDGLHDFALRSLSAEGALFSLTAKGEDASFAGGVAPRLFLIHPGVYFPDYEPTINDETLAALGAPGAPTTPENLAVLVVLNPGAAPQDTTANLLAPVVIDTTSGNALQVVLDDGSWPLRATLHAA